MANLISRIRKKKEPFAMDIYRKELAKQRVKLQTKKAKKLAREQALREVRGETGVRGVFKTLSEASERGAKGYKKAKRKKKRIQKLLPDGFGRID